MNRGPPSTKDRLRLAGRLCARLCHDLSGTLGTLSGTLELARDSRAAGANASDLAAVDEALELAGDAATVLAARLRLLRAAWAADPEALSIEQFRALAAGLNGRRLTLDLDRIEGAGPAPAFGQVALNVLLLGAESLPGGGTVALSGDADAALLATIAGPGASWPANLSTMLTDPLTAWDALDDARAIQAPMTVLLARAAGLSLTRLMSAGDAAPALLLETRG